MSIKANLTVLSTGWAAVEWVHRLRLKHPNTIPLSHGGRDCSANSILTFLQSFNTVLHMSTTIFFKSVLSRSSYICLSKRKESCSSLPSVGLRFFNKHIDVFFCIFAFLLPSVRDIFFKYTIYNKMKQWVGKENELYLWLSASVFFSY